MKTYAALQLDWQITDQRFVLSGLGREGLSWLRPGARSPLFALEVDGQMLDAGSMDCLGAEQAERADGVREWLFRFGAPELEVDYHLLIYPGAALLEGWPVLRAAGEQAVHVTRVDSLALALAGGELELLSFSGDWGREFEPSRRALSAPVTLQSRSGRSSKGDHPWFMLSGAGGVMAGAPAWSGNWVVRLEPDGAGWAMSGGLHGWQFAKTLQPGQAMAGAPLVIGFGADLDHVAQQYAAVGRAHWYARSPLSDRQAVEWNHWWPYEDVEINEDVFRRNVAAAQRLGMQVCTLDAGWFGPSEAGAAWYDYRGDWDLVNRQRFPGGIRALSDFTHERGMAFGIWCEIEGLGSQARLPLDHPDYPATRGGQRLDYVCFGSPAVQEWAFQTLSHLIEDYRADWIKLDFNLDPGAGCDRADHGHQAGDGLYEHYTGYYRTLERLRAAYPHVTLENCSSGGLRIDLGMLRRTDITFLSDPDWPVHDLQIFWGASTHLAADRLLHWGYSDWRNTNPPPQQRFNPHDPHLTPKQFDYYTRMSMLGLYGYSQKLDSLPRWMAERVALHTRIYQDSVRHFVTRADLYRLTGQPRRDGSGERWCAFQYSQPDGEAHLLFVFRLPGGEPVYSLRLRGLDPNRVYAVRGFEGEDCGQNSGQALMEHGLLFSGLAEEESALLHIA